jgi:hypothetical protein
MNALRFCLRFALISAVLATPATAGGLASEADGPGKTRGILTDQAVDLPLDPSRADAPRPTSPLVPVRLAAKQGDASIFDGLGPRVAPLEFVGADARPDLVWDPATGDLSERGELIATGVPKAQLATAADRVVLIRRLRDLAKTAGQTIRLQPDDRSARFGARLEVQLAEVAGRSVALFSVDGVGRATLLYPMKTDPAVAAQPDLAVPLDVGSPAGGDLIVALTTATDLSGFVQSLRRLDRRRAAGEVLGLIDAVAASDLKTGTRSLIVQP